jgi:hypothetical protein
LKEMLLSIYLSIHQQWWYTTVDPGYTRDTVCG